MDDKNKKIKEKLDDVTKTLKKKYSKKRKVGSLRMLEMENYDLPIDLIGTWTKKLFNISAFCYLYNEGILSHEEEETKLKQRLRDEF